MAAPPPQKLPAAPATPHALVPLDVPSESLGTAALGIRGGSVLAAVASRVKFGAVNRERYVAYSGARRD